MHKWKNWTALLCLVWFGACQAPMQTGSQCVLDQGALTGFQQVAWREATEIHVRDGTGFISPLAIQRLKAAVEQELSQKGFSMATVAIAPDDLELSVTLHARRELVAYESGGQACADSACWENAQSGRMEMRTVGFLAADIYLRDEPVWRGWVEPTLYPADRDQPGEVIARAVPKLFESFPP